MGTDKGVVDRIKKLLARATSSEPHEAALALEMANRMMREHNLSLEAVEVGPILEHKVRSVATKSKAKGWELKLLRVVAEAFGCEILFTAGQSWDYVGGYRQRVTDSRMYAHYSFVGPEPEVKLAGYAAEVLLRQLVKARARFTKTLPDHYYRADKTREVDAYLSGWVTTATAKVSKLVPRQSVRDALARYMGQFTGSVGTQQRNGGSSASREAGMRDGADAELNRPVDHGRERAGLGKGAAGLLGSGR